MTYYFYENWRAKTHRVKIHRADCGSCQNGKGQQASDSVANGKWHGPYTSVEAAVAEAVTTGARVLPCLHCNPPMPE